MRAIIALIAAWTGAPAHGADRTAPAPTYAATAADGAVSIAGAASLDAPQGAARPRLGISLAAAAPASASKASGPARPAAIYGHNVDDVVIGATARKAAKGRHVAPAGGTATSGRRAAAPASSQPATPPKR